MRDIKKHNREIQMPKATELENWHFAGSKGRQRVDILKENQNNGGESDSQMQDMVLESFMQETLSLKYCKPWNTKQI